MISEDTCCSCHISAPCTHCTSHGYCEKCDAYVDNDEMIEVEGCWLCQECEKKEMSKTVVTIQREDMEDLVLEFEDCKIDLSRNVKTEDDASFYIGDDRYAVIHGYCRRGE